nr:hypothetical protein [Tanacetum cinerariifolium]
MEDVEGCLWCCGLYGAKGKDMAIFRTKKWIVVLVRRLKVKETKIDPGESKLVVFTLYKQLENLQSGNRNQSRPSQSLVAQERRIARGRWILASALRELATEFFLIEEIDQDSAHMVAASKVPILKPVIENGATLAKTQVGDDVITVMPITTTKDKAKRRLEVKARSTLMMGILNEHQLKFNSIKDAKQLKRDLLVSQLVLLGEKISQEDVNQKLLKSLSLEWSIHVVVRRNKADLYNMSMYDLYNNLKVYEPEVKGMSSSNTNTQNMAFMSSIKRSTNGVVNTTQAVNTANEVSTASTQVNVVDNLSDAIICAFLAIQPNSPQLVHEDLEKIHPDDIEEIDLRWQMAMLTLRAERFLKKTRRKLTVNGNESLGRDLRLADEEGVDCLPKSTIFEILELIGKPKRKNTQVPQASGSIEHVADEAVYKELDDILVRGATIVSCLEAEQDNGNIDKTQSKATPNKASSPGTTLGGGPRVDSFKDDQSLGEDASKQGRKIYDINVDEDITLINDQDDAEMFNVNCLHGERCLLKKKLLIKRLVLLVKLMLLTTDEITLAQALVKINTSKPKAKRIILQEPKPVKPKKKDQIRLDKEASLKLQAEFDEEENKVLYSKSSRRKEEQTTNTSSTKKIMCTYLKNVEGKKLKDLKNKPFDSIQKMFDRAFNRVNIFVDFKTELVEVTTAGPKVKTASESYYCQYKEVTTAQVKVSAAREVKEKD